MTATEKSNLGVAKDSFFDGSMRPRNDGITKASRRGFMTGFRNSARVRLLLSFVWQDRFTEQRESVLDGISPNPKSDSALAASPAVER